MELCVPPQPTACSTGAGFRTQMTHLGRREQPGEHVSRASRAGYSRGVTRPRPSSAQFGMDIEFDVGSILLGLSGELDALSVPVFSRALVALAEQGARVVTIDLTQLRLCDIGGLRAMAELAARLNDVDGRVEIIAPSILTRMVEIGDLRSLFVVHDLEAPDTSGAPVDLRTAGQSARAGRPRASSLHRLSSGT